MRVEMSHLKGAGDGRMRKKGRRENEFALLHFLVFEPSVVWKMPPHLGEDSPLWIPLLICSRNIFTDTSRNIQLISSLGILHPVRLTQPLV